MATTDLPTARALVRLRFALEHATALARDPSEPAAHTAIVALDGVVEHALWLAARAYGSELKQSANRHDLLNKVRQALAAAGKPWQSAGTASVDQLHRARNDAQHAAVQFDPAQLPDWSTGASAFIDGLVAAAFGRPLSDVTLADAVRGPGLADLLRRAEQDIELPESDAAAFLLICAAFDEARRRWREQQTHVYGQRNELMFQSELPALGMLERDVSQHERLADFLEVVPFASDLGEYSWFLATRRQQKYGWTPEPADSRRALVFVSGWVVRWEVFDRGYPLERWQEHFESVAPPLVGDGSTTEIIGGEALLTSEDPGRPARCHLLFTLANVPDRARGPWGHWLVQALADAANELHEDLRFDHARLSLTGQLLLICQLGYEADAVFRVVTRGVERADERYRDWSDSEALRSRELRRLKDAFSQVIFSARQGLALFASVEVTERGADGKPIVWLGFNFGDSKFEELGLCTQGFQSAGGVLASAGTLQDHVVFDAFELTTEKEVLLRDTVQRCEEIVLARRTDYSQRVLEFQLFQNRLAEFF